MNPHYLSYCRAHGRSPEEQQAHDRQEWPLGRMVGFITWMSQQKRAFQLAHPKAFCGDVITDRAAWSRWLETCPVITDADLAVAGDPRA